MTRLSNYKSATVVNDNGEIGIAQKLNLKQLLSAPLGTELQPIQVDTVYSHETINKNRA